MSVEGPIVLPWVKSTEVYTVDGGMSGAQPSPHFMNAIYLFNIGTSGESYGPPRDTWTVADFRPWGIPGDDDPLGPAKWVEIDGLLVMTPGTISLTCALLVWYRKVGDATASKSLADYCYGAQALANPGQGVRQKEQNTIALVDGQCEWAWSVVDTSNNPVPDDYPLHPAIGVNLSPIKWGR